jgi:hypothetical protein
MAVGDAVIQMSAGGTTLVFQPAATVTVMITQLCGSNASTPMYYTDGTNVSEIVTSRTNYSSVQSSMKMFINNTIYLQMNTSGSLFSSFSGVQIA